MIKCLKFEYSKIVIMKKKSCWLELYEVKEYGNYMRVFSSISVVLLYRIYQ
jgi:hypothetical protein